MLIRITATSKHLQLWLVSNEVRQGLVWALLCGSERVQLPTALHIYWRLNHENTALLRLFLKKTNWWRQCKPRSVFINMFIKYPHYPPQENCVESQLEITNSYIRLPIRFSGLRIYIISCKLRLLEFTSLSKNEYFHLQIAWSYQSTRVSPDKHIQRNKTNLDLLPSDPLRSSLFWFIMILVKIKYSSQHLNWIKTFIKVVLNPKQYPFLS